MAGPARHAQFVATITQAHARRPADFGWSRYPEMLDSKRTFTSEENGMFKRSPRKGLSLKIPTIIVQISLKFYAREKCLRKRLVELIQNTK